MADIQYFTEEGLENLKRELHDMKTVQRPAISQQIAEARDKGDLSENAEYDAAKEAQGMLEARIAKMEDLLSRARIIDQSKLDNSKVLILSTVKVRNLATKKELEYTIVTEKEADLKLGRISSGSPISKGLLGKSVGDIVDIVVPAGKIQLEILEIHF
jgi:transcription elongation factor GreA